MYDILKKQPWKIKVKYIKNWLCLSSKKNVDLYGEITLEVQKNLNSC